MGLYHQAQAYQAAPVRSRNPKPSVLCGGKGDSANCSVPTAFRSAAAWPFPYPEHLHLPVFIREETFLFLFLNLYGSFTQMAGDLRRWQGQTLTDHLVFSFQAKVFIAENKQGEVRGFEIQGKVNWIRKKQLQHSCPGQWS